MSALQAILKEDIKGMATISRNLRDKQRKAGKHLRGRNNPDVAEYEADLQSYRMGLLRRNQRYTQLAYAFIRGVPYSDVEQSTRPNNRVNVCMFKGVLNALNFDPDVVAFADLWFTAE